MDTNAMLNGLVMYLCFIPILTFHEFAHAWVAWKLGDDTAHREGRVTLNPQSHICPIGTILIPGIAVLLMASGSGLSGFLIGWGKPVPVNLGNLKNVRRDDNLISLAGPAMNVVLAFVCLILAKFALMAGLNPMVEMLGKIALLSLFLCFFNLLPIPPLDGSHVLKNALQMRHETYAQFASYGFIALIIAIQIPAIRQLLSGATVWTLNLMLSVLSIG